MDENGKITYDDPSNKDRSVASESQVRKDRSQYASTQMPIDVNAPVKSKIVAGLLGVFLGMFGAHNFYLGKTSKAMTQLLMTVLSLGILSFVSEAWGFIEGIMILSSQTGSPWHLDGYGRDLTD